MAIQAIETSYAGCRFRSRLEARWAVFFDHLGIQWEYEPQGFELPAGSYLPDFQLFDIGGDGRDRDFLWFEVKPPTPRGDDDPRWHELTVITQAPLIVTFGMPRPDEDLVWGRGADYMELFDVDGWDNGRAFCTCPTCGRLGITFGGRGPRVCWHDGTIDDKNPQTAHNPIIIAAYTAARSARFEYGEQPQRVSAHNGFVISSIETLLAGSDLTTADGRVFVLRHAAPIIARGMRPRELEGTIRWLAGRLGMEIKSVTRAVMLASGGRL